MRAIVTLLVLSTFVSAQDISIPDKVDAKTMRLAVVEIKTTAKDLQWAIVPSDNIDYFREYSTDPSIVRLRFLPYVDGKFSLVVAGALSDKVSQKVCVITATGGVPVPPPDPPGPAPPDAFRRSLISAYVADGKPAALVEQLASVYSGSGDLVANGKNTKGVLLALHKRAVDLIGESSLPSLRNAIANELDAKLGTSNMTMTADIQANMTRQFANVSNALRLLKGQ